MGKHNRAKNLSPDDRQFPRRLMPLHLRYRASTTLPVEVEGLTPDAVRDKSLAEIEQTPIFHGNRTCALAEFFTVSGDPSDERIVWEGELAGVHWIGAHMRSGEIRVEGNAGRHVGSEMAGGAIHVSGNVGDWLGAEMKDGLIRVHGRAGHFVGAAYRGSRLGMKGGTILVEGDVGDELGHRLRRGLIAVGGNAGDLVGFNMAAGAIFVFGEAGLRHGAGMRRGSLGFFGRRPPPMLPSFRFACRYRPPVMTLMFRQLQSHGFHVPDDMQETSFDLYNGDLIEGGRGEILLRASPAAKLG